MTQLTLPQIPAPRAAAARRNAGEGLAEPGGCVRCGRPWGALVDAGGLRLDVLARMPEVEAAGAVRCWIRVCGGSRS